jgi:perosamine synthetase
VTKGEAELPHKICRVLTDLFPGGAFLHEPEFRGKEWDYVKECLDTAWVSTAGKYVEQFEQQVAEYTGSKYAIAVSSGTAALHIALRLVGVGPGDEVLIPTLTFVATANAIAFERAIPHFVDSCEDTLGLDPAKLRDYLTSVGRVSGGVCLNKKTGRTIRAIVPMHTYGHPVEMDTLLEVCGDFCIAVVEDAAESLGSTYKGQHMGTIGKLGAVSFNGNKIITTGGGGMILTQDDEVGKLAKHVTTTAKVRHRWDFFHDRTGFNYRMPNLNAALGCAQMEELDQRLARKRRLSEIYSAAFSEVVGVSYFSEPKDCTSNYWLNVLLLDEPDLAQRDKVLARTNDSGVATRPAWVLMHKLPMHAESPRMDLGQACELETRLLNIPSSAKLAGLP